MKEEKNMSLVPAKFRFTTKEKTLMIVIIVLMIVGIVVTWINCAKIMKANAEYKLAYQQYQEAHLPYFQGRCLCIFLYKPRPLNEATRHWRRNEDPKGRGKLSLS